MCAHIPPHAQPLHTTYLQLAYTVQPARLSTCTRYRQDSDLLYFCGFTDPDTVLLIRADPYAPDGHHATLVVASRSAVAVKWNGPVVTAKEAVGLYGVDAAVTTDELVAVLDAELLASTTVACF